MKSLILKVSGKELFDFISRFGDVKAEDTLVVATTKSFNIKNQSRNAFKVIVNLNKINDIRNIDSFFADVNSKLSKDGIFVGCVESRDLRKRRLLKKFPPVLCYLYLAMDYVFKRVFPKLILTSWFYFFITDGRNRVISKPEAIGRLYYAGFSVIELKVIGNLLCFAVKKMQVPAQTGTPSYGPLLKMQRVGKDGRVIRVYKIRTMAPYSEFIQEYMYNKHHLQTNGKIENDYRITRVGKLLRKFWLDETPMIYNWFCGDLKLVGVRPLSKHYLGLYTKEMMDKRLRHKPGLLPPYYADMPANFEEILESEKRYLDAYEKEPFKTDVSYFFRIVSNIVFKGARSQ
ncbi:sugar transferase [Marinilabiliaceae bacterium JC017]|nr:sugar transferase [Marinilabiliaceae bacterium JC017]